MASRKSSISCENPVVKWTAVAGGGPTVMNHVACVVGNSLYVHGGVSQNRSTKPQSTLYKLDLGSFMWTEIKAENPALSHHAGVALNNRYLLLVGGWDGKVRCSTVRAFDTQQNVWLTLNSTGFPVGAGLSSHTATLLRDGKIMVIGREGSLREQRRSGNSFLLSGSVSSGSFHYDMYPISTASRSGHFTVGLGSKLLVVGGRDDKLLEVHRDWTSVSEPLPILHQILHAVKDSPLPKAPGGRKQHVCASDQSVLLIFGGETFDGRSKGAVSHLYLLHYTKGLRWYRVPTTPLARSGHVTWVHNQQLYVHGGVDETNCVSGTVHKLELNGS